MVVLNLHDDDIQNRAGETLVQCTDPCGRRKHVHRVGKCYYPKDNRVSDALAAG